MPDVVRLRESDPSPGPEPIDVLDAMRREPMSVTDDGYVRTRSWTSSPATAACSQAAGTVRRTDRRAGGGLAGRPILDFVHPFEGRWPATDADCPTWTSRLASSATGSEGERGATAADGVTPTTAPVHTLQPVAGGGRTDGQAGRAAGAAAGHGARVCGGGAVVVAFVPAVAVTESQRRSSPLTTWR